MPDPILTRCPACSHLLKVPDEFLGRVVTCLECKTPFVAPTRDGDALTAPRPLPKRPTVPAMVFVPMLGLLLLGSVGLVVNGYCFVAFGNDPQAAPNFARQVLRQLALDSPPDEPPPPTDDKGKARELTAEEKAARDARREVFVAEQDRLIDERAAEVAPYLRPARGLFTLVSLGVFAGGLAFALRRFYPWAFVACVLAIVNSPDLACCFPGAVVGVWGLFVLIGDEGRRHFRRQ